MTERLPLAEPVWFAVMCVPCQEGVASTWLRRAGYWATYPLDRYQALVSRPHGRTLVEWIDRPHFPGYIFVAIRYIAEPIGPINSIKGVIDIVRRPISREPLTIPIPVMDAILAERLFALDDERGAVVMSETHLHGDRELRVFLSSLGRWKTEPVHEKAA
jgi:transcription antitermination factor NusG